LRLAAVLLDDKAFDEALKQLDAAHAAAFDARFLEMKGDVLVAQGKKPEARAAYKAALDKGGAGRELLRQKLDNLGESA
jgi:predicted negative regulator of RcsB-dependent stress response